MVITEYFVLKVARRMARLLLWSLLLLLLLSVIAWYSFRSDNAFVIRKVEEMVQEKWNARLILEGYQLSWAQPFPLLKLQLNGLNMAKAAAPQRPVLRFNQAVSSIHPWHLLTGRFQPQPLQFDSVWVHIHKDSLNRSNLTFNTNRQSASTPKPTKAGKSRLAQLPELQANFLDFHYQDDHRNKAHRARLSELLIRPQKKSQQAWAMRLTGNSHFEGLTFKQKDGPFLQNTVGDIDLQLSRSLDGQSFHLFPSTLKVAKDVYHLQGQLMRADTNHMHLEIRHEGVKMKDVKPLLSRKIQEILKDIKIDQPLHSSFTLDRLMVPGVKAAIRVDFETANTGIQLKSTRMARAKLRGYFSNDCDGDGIGHSSSSCVVVHQLDGDIFGIIPARLKGQITRLKNPQLEATGQVDVHLTQLNSMLAPRGKATFIDGHALVDFTYAGRLVDIIEAPFDERYTQLNGQATFEQVQLELDKRQKPFPALSGQLSFNEHRTLLKELKLRWLGSNLRLTGRLSNLPEFIFYDDESFKSDLLVHFDRLDMNQFIDKNDPSARKPSTNQQADQSKKIERLEKILRRVATNINGEIRVRIDELFYDTLFAHEVSTTFRFFSPLRAEFADSSIIRMQQLRAQFMGKTPVQASLEVTQDSVPDLLLDLRLPTIVPVADIWLPSSVQLVGGSASLEVSTALPLRSLLEKERLLSDFRYRGNVQFDQLEAEAQQFSWPLKKIEGPLFFDNHQLRFDSLRFQYEGAPFLLNGTVDEYAFFKKGHTPKARVAFQLKGSYLNLRPRGGEEKEENAEGNSRSPARLFRSLDTVFQHATGKIELRLDSIATAGETIQPFYAQLRLIPERLATEKYQLVIDSFRFGFGGRDLIRGRSRIFDWEKPKIEASLQAQLSLRQLGKLLPSEYLEMQGGYMNLKLKYLSRLHETLNARNYLLNASMNGLVELVKGKLYYNYRGFQFDNIFGHFSFDENQLLIRDLDLEINGNRLFAHGHSSEFLPFFILPDRRAHIEMSMASPRFDFGAFTAPHGLGKDTVEMADTEPSGFNMGYIDRLLDKGSMNMDVDFKELIYNKFKASQLTGNISLQPDTVQLSGVKMNLAKGHFAIDGSITDVVRHRPKMQVAFQLTENDVSDIFEQFEDFGQNHLKCQNIEGFTSADISFSADINSNYSIIPETMYGDMRVKLAGVQLIELDALRKITGFLSRKRQLNHIYIDTLETLSHIRGTDLYFQKFILHSSSFDFGVEGVYSMGANKRTRLLFSVPLSNLFRRHLTLAEMAEGAARRKGLKVHIEARHKKDRLRFRLKLPMLGRKKYRLEEREE